MNIFDWSTMLGAGGWYGAFEFVRIIFISLDITLVWLLVFVARQSLKFRPVFVPNPRAAAVSKSLRDPEIQRKWNVVLAKADENPPQSCVLAVIEADKLTDEVLRRLGFEGEHMADRLEHLTTGAVKTLEDLWRAHRLRNELVHAPDFEISVSDARDVLHIYERFLKELGVI